MARARVDEVAALPVVEQLVEELRESTVELERCADLVEHLEAQRQARLEGELGEDPLGKAMNRRKRSVIELEERRLCPRRLAAASRAISSCRRERSSARQPR